MNWMQSVGLAACAVLVCTFLRQTKPEYAFLLALAAGGLLLLGVLSCFRPVMTAVQELLNQTAAGVGFTKILWKALGICLLTSFAADASRDAGENAIAQQVEFAGQAAVLLLCLPLFEELASLALELFAAGGGT